MPVIRTAEPSVATGWAARLAYVVTDDHRRGTWRASSPGSLLDGSTGALICWRAARTRARRGPATSAHRLALLPGHAPA